jgi:signal transduction histidine kinase
VLPRGAGKVPAVPELVLSAAAVFLIQLEIWVFDPGGPMAGRALAGLIAGGSLAFVRASPFAAYLANGLAIYAMIALGYPSDIYQWTNFAALFGMATRTPLKQALVGLVLGLIGVSAYFVRFPNEGGLVLAGAVAAIWTAGWFAGRVQFARWRETNLQIERDLTRAELVAQQARMELDEQRNRLARELHDIVGHAVNVMVVHAGAGDGLVTGDPDRARAAVTTIADTGRTALADLDRMLEVLQGDRPREPLPGLDRLAELCRGFVDTGLKVELETSGDFGRVPPSVGLAGYRIVQEALTNVLKHAGASRALVVVEVGEALQVSVTDDGTGGSVIPGRGLRGMTERVEVHGGALIFGPVTGGGFRVECRIPFEPVK